MSDQSKDSNLVTSSPTCEGKIKQLLGLDPGLRQAVEACFLSFVSILGMAHTKVAAESLLFK